MDDEFKSHLKNNEDFCALKRYDYSITVLRSKYKEDTIPVRVMAAALCLSEEELKAEYERIVKKLQVLMVPKLEDHDGNG